MPDRRGNFLVYLLGVDREFSDAVASDLQGTATRHPRTLREATRPRRSGRPDAVFFDLRTNDANAAVAAFRAAWGRDLLIVGVDGRRPYAQVWRGASLSEVVEIEPGFLGPFLRADRRAARGQPAGGGPARSADMSSLSGSTSLPESIPDGESDQPSTDMRAAHPRDPAAVGVSDPCASLERAYAVFGLTPGADLPLVEAAYWYQVDRCRLSPCDERARRARVQALNDARTLIMTAEADRNECWHLWAEAADRTPRWRPRCLVPLALGPSAALVGGSLAYARAWDWREALAGGVLTALCSTTAGALVGLVSRRRAARRRAPLDPFATLCVTPDVDRGLATVAYRHLRVKALRDSAIDQVRALDQAYALLDTSLCADEQAVSA